MGEIEKLGNIEKNQGNRENGESGANREISRNREMEKAVAIRAMGEVENIDKMGKIEKI